MPRSVSDFRHQSFLTLLKYHRPLRYQIKTSVSNQLHPNVLFSFSFLPLQAWCFSWQTWYHLRSALPRFLWRVQSRNPEHRQVLQPGYRSSYPHRPARSCAEIQCRRLFLWPRYSNCGRCLTFLPAQSARDNVSQTLSLHRADAGCWYVQLPPMRYLNRQRYLFRVRFHRVLKANWMWHCAGYLRPRSSPP